jgi:hypothetical protein
MVMSLPLMSHSPHGASVTPAMASTEAAGSTSARLRQVALDLVGGDVWGAHTGGVGLRPGGADVAGPPGLTNTPG